MRKLNIHVFLGKYLQNVLHSETPHLGRWRCFFLLLLAKYPWKPWVLHGTSLRNVLEGWDWPEIRTQGMTRRRIPAFPFWLRVLAPTGTDEKSPQHLLSVAKGQREGLHPRHSFWTTTALLQPSTQMVPLSSGQQRLTEEDRLSSWPGSDKVPLTVPTVPPEVQGGATAWAVRQGHCHPVWKGGTITVPLCWWRCCLLGRHRVSYTITPRSTDRVHRSKHFCRVAVSSEIKPNTPFMVAQGME